MWGSPSLGVSVCLLAARERACYKIEGHGAPHTHRKRTRTGIRTGGGECGRGGGAGVRFVSRPRGRAVTVPSYDLSGRVGGREPGAQLGVCARLKLYGRL